MSLTSHCSVFQISLGFRSFKTICYATYIMSTFILELYLVGYDAVRSVESQPTSWKNIWNQRIIQAKLFSCLAYSSTMLMEATCVSETSVDFLYITRHDTPEDRTVHNHGNENFGSYVLIQILFSLRIFFCGRVLILSCKSIVYIILIRR
jgi:hypothetical protein